MKKTNWDKLTKLIIAYESYENLRGYFVEIERMKLLTQKLNKAKKVLKR